MSQDRVEWWDLILVILRFRVLLPGSQLQIIRQSGGERKEGVINVGILRPERQGRKDDSMRGGQIVIIIDVYRYVSTSNKK
jgi:hypothetical protein